MSDTYQSSDQIKTIENRQLGANIIETTLYMDGSAGSGTFSETLELVLDDLNLGTLVPEFDVYMWWPIIVSGPGPGTFEYYNFHYKLPVISEDRPEANITARAYVLYESTGGVKGGVTPRTAVFRVQVDVVDWDGVHQLPQFFVKIKGSDSITA